MEEILRKLISFPTNADDSQSTHEALDYIASFVALRGMHVERYEYEGVESLIATVRPYDKHPRVMLAAHLDVVPADEAQYELQEREGKYFGRGVLDMKGVIACYLQFIDQNQDKLTEYDFALMITSDEEVGGGASVEKLLQEGYRPDVCILPDGGDNWQIQTYSKGFFALKLLSDGVPAHGSRPWLGENAILPLIQALEDIKSLFPNMGPETNTVNFGIIKGGAAHNQVADHAEATIDVRLTDESERQRLRAEIAAICEKYDIGIQVIVSGAVGKFSLQDPYIAPFAQLITEVTGITVEGSRTLGSNDARFFSAEGIPCISFYPVGGGHHGPDEWLDKQSFMQLGEIIQRYMDQIALQAARTPQNTLAQQPIIPA